MPLLSTASPAFFKRLSPYLLPVFGGVAGLLFVPALYFALVASPPDYQQGEAVRMMYVHVPAAWMALLVYGVVGGASAVFLVWKHRMADMIARESAGLGAGFTLICLLTGMLWGKPMWGAWWVWDARLTSVLVLFFLYVAYIVLSDAMDESERGRKAAAILALIGLANLPVIRFSVEWWSTLHQPASILRKDGPSIHDPAMLSALFLMFGAYLALYGLILTLRVQAAQMNARARRLQLRKL